MKPLIAHLTEKYAVTGENYIYEQALLAKQHDSVILAEFKVKNEYLPFQNYSSFSVLKKNVFLQRLRNFTANKVFSGFYLNRLNHFFQKEVSSKGAKLIHAHFGMMGSKCLLAKRKLNLPLIVTFYGVDASHCVKSPYWKPRFQKMFQEGSLFITLCEEARDRLIQIGCPPEKTVIWDIGIPIEEYPYRSPRPSSRIKFLTVARFVEKKGYPYLLEAFSKFSKVHPDSTLTIMGNGPLKQDIQKIIDELGLSSQVKLIDTAGMLNFFDRFKEALHSHDVFVLPSVVAKDGDDEGGPPVVLTNAMAVGLPVISTPVGGITRAIRDGQNGLLCRSEDGNDLFLKMEYLFKNPKEWERLSLAARKTIEDQFTLSKQIAKLEEYYAKVLKDASMLPM